MVHGIGKVQISAVTVVDSSHSADVGSGAVAVIGLMIFREPVETFLVKIKSFGLIQYGTVMFKAQKFKIPQDAVTVFLSASGGVDVFNTKMPEAVKASGTKITTGGSNQ